MRKMLWVLIAGLLLTCAPMQAGEPPYYYKWDPVSTVGTTALHDMSNGGAPPSKHTLSVEIASGSPSACTYRYEGSLDKTNWFDLSGTQSCMATTMFHVADKPVLYARINVLSLSGTATLVFRHAGGM